MSDEWLGGPGWGVMSDDEAYAKMAKQLNTSENASVRNSEFSPHNSSFAKGASIVERSFEFAVRVVRLCRFLDDKDRSTRTLASQLLRSGTSVGANIEEAQAGQSKAKRTLPLKCRLFERKLGKHSTG